MRCCGCYRAREESRILVPVPTPWRSPSEEDIREFREFEKSFGLSPKKSRKYSLGPMTAEQAEAIIRADYPNTPIEELPLYRQFVAEGKIKPEAK